MTPTQEPPDEFIDITELADQAHADVVAVQDALDGGPKPLTFSEWLAAGRPTAHDVHGIVDQGGGPPVVEDDPPPPRTWQRPPPDRIMLMLGPLTADQDRDRRRRQYAIDLILTIGEIAIGQPGVAPREKASDFERRQILKSLPWALHVLGVTNEEMYLTTTAAPTPPPELR